jgi:hypothetical protein
LEATARIFVNYFLCQAVVAAKRSFDSQLVSGLAVVPEQILPEDEIEGVGVVTGVTDFATMQIESLKDESTTTS